MIILAHYDTVASSPGADDNASGVAVLLELATVLQSWRCGRTMQFIGVNLMKKMPGRATLLPTGTMPCR